jgi:hypothetical protein
LLIEGAEAVMIAEGVYTVWNTASNLVIEAFGGVGFQCRIRPQADITQASLDEDGEVCGYQNRWDLYPHDLSAVQVWSVIKVTTADNAYLI